MAQTDIPDVEYIELTPDWKQTAAWFARALKDHSFDRGAAEPVINLIEQIRYLTQTDLAAVQEIIDNLKNKNY